MEATGGEAPGDTVLCGVLGWPVAHSRSPVMHDAAFAALGLPWRYVHLPVPPELFAETARALGASGFRGANVTIPHKQAALRVADEASSAAQAIGAANTLTFTAGGVTAENTDAGGLLDAIGAPPETALVLGAGGAGRAAVYALRQAGTEVALWNRTPERASELAGDLGASAVADPAAVLADCEALVNTTSVGLDVDEDPGVALGALGLGSARAPRLVVDMVYGPRPTPVLAWGERAGSRTVDGLEVLVRQGARSLALWTGLEPPVEVMRAAARAG